MYRLEKKDESADYTKRQILLVQEEYKIMLPALVLLVAALVALDAANIVHEFMALYVNVLVNIIGVCAALWLASKMLSDNRHQRELFEFLGVRQGIGSGELTRARYLGDTDGVLKGAGRVNIVETESAIVVTAALPGYRHVPFTSYDFSADFGRLVLPRSEFAAERCCGGVTIRGEGREFRFEAEDAQNNAQNNI